MNHTMIDLTEKNPSYTKPMYELCVDYVYFGLIVISDKNTRL